MSNPNKINVAIVDDDLLVVQLLTQFLTQSTDVQFEIVITANGGDEFLEKLTKTATPVDILLLDLRMKHGDGLSVLEELRKQKTMTKVIVLSSYYKPAYIGQMMQLNAHAFLPKEIDKEELIDIIQELYAKGYYLNSDQVNSLRTQITPKAPKLHIDPKDLLTNRELEVLELIAHQKTTKEIANELFVSPKTVEAHKSNLFSKTGVKNMAGLMMYAIQQHLIDPNEFMLLG
ncbi:MAG: response regulator transcription factor [Aureispira sp.]